MVRVLKNKKLKNTKLATNYGGWMYCTECGENIGYLCYSTYDRISLDYKCNCGSCGSVYIDFEDSKTGESCDNELKIIKSRFCCIQDESPLITLLDKKLANYKMEITCKSCNKIYNKSLKI